MRRTVVRRTVGLGFGLLVVGGQTSIGQGRVDQPAGVIRARSTELPPDTAARAALHIGSQPARSGSWLPRRSASMRRYAPIASALVPGSGQFILGEDRFVAYAAVEAAMWLKRRNDRADQSRQEQAFRTLARNVARVNYSPNPPDGAWEYYEDMRKFLESGEYSLVDGRLVPEARPETFNGFIWQSALEHNPDSASALAEYERRAVKPDFRWSWKNARLEWDIFKRQTEQRNGAAGRVASDLVVIGANHVLSMVDAFRSWRLRAYTPPGGGVGVRGQMTGRY